MELMEKYKIRLKQLQNGHKELYEGEIKVIINILSTYNRI